MYAQGSAELQRAAFDAELSPVLCLAYRYAKRLVGSHDDAMDLVQDSAVSAFRAFHTYTPGTNFKAWFLRILTNRYYATHRNRLATVALADAPELYLYDHAKQLGTPMEEDPAAHLLGKMDGEAIQAAIDRLPEEYRVVAVLHFLSEMPYEEIAHTLEVPIGTVRSRLHRGRKQLQVSLWQIAEERGYARGGV
ncbi:MAG: sigma-70 family RNA polymerase sigma factor [Fimbriimonas sp.]